MNVTKHFRVVATGKQFCASALVSTQVRIQWLRIRIQLFSLNADQDPGSKCGSDPDSGQSHKKLKFTYFYIYGMCSFKG